MRTHGLLLLLLWSACGAEPSTGAPVHRARKALEGSAPLRIEIRPVDAQASAVEVEVSLNGVQSFGPRPLALPALPRGNSAAIVLGIPDGFTGQVAAKARVLAGSCLLASGAGQVSGKAGETALTLDMVASPSCTSSNPPDPTKLPQYQWALRCASGSAGDGLMQPQDMVIDPDPVTGGVIVAALLNGKGARCRFSGDPANVITLRDTQAHGGMLAKLDRKGTLVWARDLGGLWLDGRTTVLNRVRLAVGGQGEIFLSASLDRWDETVPFRLDPQGDQHPGGMVLARFSRDGKLVWDSGNTGLSPTALALVGGELVVAGHGVQEPTYFSLNFHDARMKGQNFLASFDPRTGRHIQLRGLGSPGSSGIGPWGLLPLSASELLVGGAIREMALDTYYLKRVQLLGLLPRTGAGLERSIADPGRSGDAGLVARGIGSFYLANLTPGPTGSKLRRLDGNLADVSQLALPREPLGMAVAENNDLLLAGTFSANTFINGVPVNLRSASTDAFVLRIQGDLSARWSEPLVMGGSGADNATAVAVDPVGGGVSFLGTSASDQFTFPVGQIDRIAGSSSTELVLVYFQIPSPPIN